LLEEQLTALVKESGEDIVSYCGRAQKIPLQLIATGETCSEDRLIRAILRGLPEEFGQVREVLMYQTSVTVERVLTHLQVAEERIYSVEQVTSLKARVTGDLSPDMRKVKCFGCGKIGHYKRDCKSQQRKKKTKSKDAVPAEQSVAMVVLHGPGDVAVDEAADDRVKGQRMEWILDSGARAHIVNDATVARNVKVTKQKVAMVDGTAVAAQGICSIDVTSIVDGKEVSITLHDVLLVPEAPYNLLSQNAVQDRGIEVHAKGKTTRLLYNGRVVAVARCNAYALSGLPVIKMWARKMQLVAVAVAAPRCKLSAAESWQGRFGHLSYNTLARMAKYGSVKGLTASEKEFREEFRPGVRGV
jgi:hypothetical protein